MSDLISRAEVIEAIDYRIAHKSSASRVKGSFTDGMIDAYCRIKSDVRIIPSAERRARWIIERGGTVMHCDGCGWAFEYHAGLEDEWNYCPHCGAKEEGQKE